MQKNIKGLDLAVYGYHGFWPFPSGFDPVQGSYLFPSLNVYGLSAERGLLKGVLATEIGYYYSDDDPKGSDPLIRNSEFRALINYSRDFKKGFSATLQYYVEIMSDYDTYLINAGSPQLNNHLDMITLRLTKLASKQRLRMSIFTFYGISNRDFYIRPQVSYKLSDYWKIEVGSNIFGGQNPFTFWNQFNSNNNFYLGLKWSV